MSWCADHGAGIRCGDYDVRLKRCAGFRLGFTWRYGLHRLVYFESHGDILSAIQREKNIKHWPRAWKTRLTVRLNPGWDDLFDDLPL
jgi:putative endonuclease